MLYQAGINIDIKKPERNSFFMLSVPIFGQLSSNVLYKISEKRDAMQKHFTQIGPKRSPEITADIFGKHDY